MRASAKSIAKQAHARVHSIAKQAHACVQLQGPIDIDKNNIGSTPVQPMNIFSAVVSLSRDCFDMYFLWRSVLSSLI